MTKYITQAVYNGTKQNYAISGRDVDSILKAARKRKELREATCFLFYSRRTGNLIDVRMN